MHSRRLPADEIIDLNDRRRVLLHVVLGLDVDPTTADEVFAVDGRRCPTQPRHAPELSIEGGLFAVENPSFPTA